MKTPIAITCYNRVDTLKQTLESLKENYGKREVHFFCDGYVHQQQLEVFEVWKYLDDFDYEGSNYFIHKSDEHLGLKKNTFAAIDSMLYNWEYDKFILLQDDMEFSKDFLQFMDWALENYKEDHRIMFVSGHSHIELKTDILYTNNFISEGLGIWKRKFPHDYELPSDNRLWDFAERTSEFFASILRKAIRGQIESPMMFLNYAMTTRYHTCLHPGKNKLRHLVTDSQNCKAKDAEILNRNLSEGWDKTSMNLLIGMNEPVRELHKRKWYKKITRILSEMYGK